MSRLFIAGVGTGVGKTLVTTILCRQLRAAGRSVSALKPVVSGYVEGDPDSDPALILHSLGSLMTPSAIAEVSPWRFAAPISPHLAARREGRTVTLDEIVRFCRRHDHGPGSICLIEGAGGVMSPICERATNAHLAVRLGEPVVLVTGTYLGTLSHTLTALSALVVLEMPVRGIVVSDSLHGVGLEETIDGLREFGAADIPILPLPRLKGDRDEQWREAPPLIGVCEVAGPTPGCHTAR
jgi:dethiobiotin synthetase